MRTLNFIFFPFLGQTGKSKTNLESLAAFHLDIFGSSPAADILFFAFIVAVSVAQQNLCKSLSVIHRNNIYKIRPTPVSVPAPRRRARERSLSVSLPLSLQSISCIVHEHAHRLYYKSLLLLLLLAWCAVRCRRANELTQLGNKSIHDFGVEFREQCSRRIIRPTIRTIFDGNRHMS